MKNEKLKDLAKKIEKSDNLKDKGIDQLNKVKGGIAPPNDDCTNFSCNTYD
jgi:hypothetical protein